MKETKTTTFQGTDYFDDRLFVLYLCPGKVEIEPNTDGAVWTTIYHNPQDAPPDHIWCVITYRNYGRYPLARIDHFLKKEDAVTYMEKVEPECPLISLNGNAPLKPKSFEEYSRWKKDSNFKEYDWKSLYLPGGAKQEERIGQTKEQFNGIR